MAFSSCTSPRRNPSTSLRSEKKIPMYKTPHTSTQTKSVIAVPHSVRRTPMVRSGRASIFPNDIADTANRVNQRPVKAVIHFFAKPVDMHVHHVRERILVHVPHVL